jgi:hypothetical protein
VREEGGQDNKGRRTGKGNIEGGRREMKGRRNEEDGTRKIR